MEDLEYLMYVDEEEREKIYNSEMKEAFKNGELNGELKAKKETIKNSLKSGLTLEQISNIVNMPINEILVIQNEINNNE